MARRRIGRWRKLTGRVKPVIYDNGQPVCRKCVAQHPVGPCPVFPPRLAPCPCSYNPRHEYQRALLCPPSLHLAWRNRPIELKPLTPEVLK